MTLELKDVVEAERVSAKAGNAYWRELTRKVQLQAAVEIQAEKLASVQCKLESATLVLGELSVKSTTAQRNLAEAIAQLATYIGA